MFLLTAFDNSPSSVTVKLFAKATLVKHSNNNSTINGLIFILKNLTSALK
jgi:hypothetical protein